MRDYRTAQADRRIGALLRVPFLTVVDRIYSDLIEAGFDDLSHAHLAFFRHIDDVRGSRVADLAAEAQMTKQSMGYLVDYLEVQGYVERIDDPSDGRARLVCLTARGQAVMEVAREATRQIEEEWSLFLGTERMDQFIDTLKRLTTMLEDRQRGADRLG